MKHFQADSKYRGKKRPQEEWYSGIWALHAVTHWKLPMGVPTWDPGHSHISTLMTMKGLEGEFPIFIDGQVTFSRKKGKFLECKQTRGELLAEWQKETDD